MMPLRRLGSVACALGLAAALLAGCGAGSGEGNPRATEDSTSTASATPEGTESPEAETPGTSAPGDGAGTSIADEVQIVADLEDGSGFRRVYAVAPDLTDDDAIVDLVTRLHEAEPDALWWLYSNDEMADVLAESLPRTAEGDLEGYPAEWVEENTLAHLVLMTDGTERYWSVLKGWDSGTELAQLPYGGEYG